jgi:group I intron endonuclease
MSAVPFGLVYGILNILDSKRYTGSTGHGCKRRWGQHRGLLNRGRHHCKPLQHAWVKHGEAVFIFEVIEAVERKQDLIPREQLYLDKDVAAGLAYNTSRTAGTLAERYGQMAFDFEP